MKNIYVLFGLILSFLLGFGRNTVEGLSDDRIVHKAMKEAGDEIQKKYQLHFGGISEQGDKENDNKYKEIGLIFSSKRFISKNEARKITLGSIKIFLDKLNTQEMRPFLTVYPFTEKNIDLSVTFNISKEKWDYSQVAFFGLLNGKLYYWYKLPNERFETRDEYESYSEAVKILEQENQNME